MALTQADELALAAPRFSVQESEPNADVLEDLHRIEDDKSVRRPTVFNWQRRASAKVCSASG